MPLSSQANFMGEGELELAVGQAIAACDGDLVPPSARSPSPIIFWSRRSAS